MKCANEGRLGFLQHLPWSICFDRSWLDGGKTFYANYLLHSASITQMVLQKTTNGGKFVTSCLVVTWERSCHSDDNASQIVRFSRKGLTPCFVGTNFSAACVCHCREENVWRQVIGVMEAKIRSELEGVSGPLTSFFSSLKALVVKSKLHKTVLCSNGITIICTYMQFWLDNKSF